MALLIFCFVFQAGKTAGNKVPGGKWEGREDVEQEGRKGGALKCFF